MFYVYKRKSKVKKQYPIISCDTPGEAWVEAYRDRHYYDDIKVVDEEGKPFLAFEKNRAVYFDTSMIEDGEEISHVLGEIPKEKTYNFYFNDEELSMRLTNRNTKQNTM